MRYVNMNNNLASRRDDCIHDSSNQFGVKYPTDDVSNKHRLLEGKPQINIVETPLFVLCGSTEYSTLRAAGHAARCSHPGVN